MIKDIAATVLCPLLFAVSLVLALPEPAPPTNLASDDRFAVQSIERQTFYRSNAVETIQANGQEYLAFEAEPEKVDAVIIETTGNSVPWLSVQRVGSDQLPTVLDEFAPGKFLFEHAGPGKYHIGTQGPNNKPAFAEFTIDQPTDPDPGDPGDDDDPTDDPRPPPSDHAQLADIVQDKRPAGEQNVADALAAGYRKAIADSQGDDVTLEQAWANASQRRRQALLGQPPLVGNWNALTIAASAYLEKLETKADYLAALEVMAAQLAKPIAEPPAAAAAPRGNPPPVVYQTLPPATYWPPLPNNCPGGVCPPRRIFRR